MVIQVNNIVTLIVEYDQYEDVLAFFSELQSAKLKFWYLHKSGNIRLRISKSDVLHVSEKLKPYHLEAVETLYEPEVFLFGGINSIDYIHELFCDIAGISIRTKLFCDKNMRQKGFDKCICLHFINQMLQFCNFDDFEEWDVWNKVCEHRQLDINKYGIILLSKLYDVQQAISNDMFDLSLHESTNVSSYYDHARLMCNKLIDLSYSTQLTRGIRGIFSTIIIFGFNMMGLSAPQQCGFSHIMRVLTNPDFRRGLGI